MKKIFLILFLTILLVGTISAELITFDNVKHYDETTQTVTIVNTLGLGRDISTIQLNTPLNMRVGAGYRKVAELKLTLYDDTYAGAFNKMEFYDLKSDWEVINRQFDYKYKTTELVDVNDYGTICSFNKVNGTEECYNEITGTHKEEKVVWKDLDTTTLLKGTYTIGIFTDVQVGDYVEWIPTLFGKKIDEWASWTADLNTDLIAYWKLNENTGTNAESSVDANYNLTGANSPTWTSSGKIGNATDLELDNSEYWTRGAGDLFPAYNQAYSFSLWVKPESLSGALNEYILSKSASASVNYGRYHLLQEGTNNHFMYTIHNVSGTQSTAESTTVVTIGNWFHIVISYDGSTNMTIWVNGVLEGTDEIASYKDDGESAFYIGRAAYSTPFYYDGIIDEVGYWNRSLTSAEITQLYNSGTGITYTNDSQSLNYSTGYPYVNQSFRVSEFINVSGNNFTLAGETYKLQGIDAYYLSDYGTNHTYDDSGNEINNSKEAVLEILNEAHSLGVNVIRTWASGAGSAGSHWILNESGGHYNLFEVGEPGNYSNTTLESLDWVVSEAGDRGIRLQLVLVNNWDDYGGMRWYVQQSPTTDKTYQWINDTDDPNYWKFHDQFYNDTNTIQYYKDYINMLLNRNNTVTGVLYKNDPTIFAWLLANEPRAKSDADRNGDLIRNWTIEMTSYIKSIDSNHLVGLGIEGWGSPFEGTDFIEDHNNTGVDFATFELHPDQWDWFAQRGEGSSDLDWIDGGITDNDTIDWWTIGTGYSWNNRYEGSYIPNYNPALTRHAYDNWIKQNTKWAEINLSMPVLLQEVAMPSSSNDSQKDRFYQQAIHNFFDNGGDGFIYWNLNHDNYYYSTTPDGIMDDGYSFYVSDDPTLKAKSQSVIDAFNFTKYDNNGGSWIDELNNFKYNFVVNINTINPIQNCSLYLNISNGTSWTGVNLDQTNSTNVGSGQDYTFTKQFDTTDEGAYWYTTCYDNETSISSDSTFLQIQSTNPPIVTLISPENNTVSGAILNYNVSSGLAISSCELHLNSSLSKTDYTVIRNVSQTFNIAGYPEEIYNWYVKCYDIGSTTGTSDISVFTLDLTSPTIILTSPVNESYKANNDSINLNWTVTDANGIGSCWYDYDNINNTVTCVDNTTTFNYVAGVDSLTFYANDTLGNLNSSSISWYYNILENSRTFNNLSYQTESETYSINLTANSSLTEVLFDYNGTEYSTTQSSGIYSKTFDIPLASSGNNSIRWKFTYAGGTVYSNYDYQQIEPTYFGLCNATLTVPYINFTFKDEETLLDLNATIDSSTWSYWFGSGTVTKSFLYSNTTTNLNYAFCLSPGNVTMHNTRSIQYASTGYPQRKYDASNDLTNSTTNQTLYLLSSADGIYSTIQVVDQNGDKVGGLEVTAERDFAGVPTVVGQETTDDAGLVTFWLNPDYDHTFTFAGGDSCTGVSVTVRPTQTQYTQQLQCGVGDEIYVSQIEGIKYARTPATGIIQAGTHNFTYQIVSSKDNIINASFKLVNASTGSVLNSTWSTCTPSGCTISFMHTINLGDDIKGKYYFDIGNGSILLEGDARWRVIDIPTKGKAGIGTFIKDMKYVIDEWGDNSDTADFNRLVIVFFFMAIIISTLNYNFGNDTQNPGAFLMMMTFVILMGSMVGGTTGQGFFYYNNLTTNNFINNYLLSFFSLIITISYFLNVNRQVSR